MRRQVRHLWLATGLLMALAAADVAVWLVLGSHVAMVRWVPVPELGGVRTAYAQADNPALPADLVGADPLVLLRGVMNAVHKVEDFHSRDFPTLWNHVAAGGGLLCRGMADLYYHALRRNGVEARRVRLARNLLEPFDTHQTVEVFQEGKWRIYDPTFNVSFQRGGSLLGAQEIHDSLLAGTTADIQPVFHGEVSYPARLDRYYVHWLPLFDNVFVLDVPTTAAFALLPPWRYWLGPRGYYEQTGANDKHFALLDRVYFTVVALVPITVIALGGGLLLAAWRRRRP
jgi:hypothetical protein